MGILANSYKGAAQATAFSRGMSPERFAERADAYNQYEQSRQDLATRKATEPTVQDRENMAEKQTLALQNSIEEQKKMMRENNRQTSYSAFSRYDADGDVRHVNTMLEDFRQRGVKLYGKVNRVDKINSTDVKLMQDMGLSPDFIKQVFNPNSSVYKSYVKITGQDGNVSFGDLDTLKGITKYNRVATKEELSRQEDARTLEGLEMAGYKLGPGAEEAFRRTRAEFPQMKPEEYKNSEEFQEAYTRNLDTMEAKGYGDRLGNTTNEEGYAERALADEGLYPGDENYNARYNELIREYANRQKPSKVKQLEGATEAQNELQEMDFLDMDTSSLSSQQTNNIETKIRDLEQLGGAELKADTRKNLLRIRGLTHLGDKAGELTEKETGLLDNLLFNVKKYIFDEAPAGTDAAAAYALYRNTARHAQFGSVLPAGEIKSFTEAFGSLGMQAGPVLSMLRESLVQLKHDYNAIADLENPYVMKWRTGMGEIELEDTINKLDDRIGMIDRVANDTPITTEPLQKSKFGTDGQLFKSSADKKRLELMLLGDGQ